MLSRLHIRDLAVLDEVELELGAGFTVLTGETGAGKSMLVDALALALGARADSAAVRSGAARAEVTAEFDLATRPATLEWLRNHDLDAAAECQLRRVVTGEGRSRGYINGHPVPLESLRELGDQLVEICGQHAHQSLLRPAMQRQVLDAFGTHERLCASVAAAHRAWDALRAERATLRGALEDREAREELLRFQVQELAALGLGEGESEDLEREQLLLANVGRIATGLGAVLERIYDAEDSSAYEAVGTARRELDALLALDPALGPASEALGQAAIGIAEAAEELRRRLARLEHDPARQNEVEARLDTIRILARRHRVAPGALWRTLPALESELRGLSARDERLREIDAEEARLAEQLRASAAELTAARVTAARSLSTAGTAGLRQLGMPDASFVVGVEPAPGGTIGPGGADHVEFLVTTNAGQPPGPLARVASGGELSRLGLAIRVVALADDTPTLVFDEVDAGIGGGVAEIVGERLRALGRNLQVLCVTHLPQVASQADHHLAVSKSSARGATRATARALSGTERVEEIARMLGGVKITERTLAHAREMLRTKRRRRAG